MAGILLAAECSHNKYGSVILIRTDLKVENVYERVHALATVQDGRKATTQNSSLHLLASRT